MRGLRFESDSDKPEHNPGQADAGTKPGRGAQRGWTHGQPTIHFPSSAGHSGSDPARRDHAGRSNATRICFGPEVAIPTRANRRMAPIGQTRAQIT